MPFNKKEILQATSPQPKKTPEELEKIRQEIIHESLGPRKLCPYFSIMHEGLSDCLRENCGVWNNNFNACGLALHVGCK